MRTAVLYNFLLEANVMASIAIVLMTVVRKLLRKQLGNRLIRFAWLLVAIRLLCPLALPNPAINEIRSAFALDPAIRPIAGQIQVRITDILKDFSWWVQGAAGRSSGIAENMNSLVDATYNGMLSLRLMQVYLLGLTVVACWFLLSNLRFRYRLRADRIEPISGKLLEQYKALCAERGVKPIPVYFTDPLPSACLTGVLRPYIALPLTAPPQEAVTVLTHEICHYKGHDHIWGLLRLLCCAIHWFNPLVWLAAHMHRTDTELACDDRVICTLNDEQRRAYANVLVLAASRRAVPGVAVLATNMTMTSRSLRTRVHAILHSGTAKKGLALTFAIVACMALGGAFATAEYIVTPEILQIDPVKSEIEARPIQSQEDAIAYAKTLWQSDYLAQDIDGMRWGVEKSGDIYYITADNDTQKLQVHFGADGVVTYLRNGFSKFDYGFPTQDDYEDQEDLCQYLLNFVDALHPGDSDRIEAFHYEGELAHNSSSFISYIGYTFARDETEQDTYSLFVVQISPVIRVVNYAIGIPQSALTEGLG